MVRRARARVVYFPLQPPMGKSLKPLALIPGSRIAVVAPASSAKVERIARGCENLARLDYQTIDSASIHKPDGYFSAPLKIRLGELQEALSRRDVRAVFCSRGGYGSAEILDRLKVSR